MNLNTNQAHDRPPPGTREGAGGPPQVLPPAVIPATAINPQAAAAIAALAASNDADSAPPGGLEPHYQAYNGTPTGWAAPPPRHPQWQEPEPQQQQQQPPPPTLLSSSTTSPIQVQAVSCFRKLPKIVGKGPKLARIAIKRAKIPDFIKSSTASSI